MAKKTKEKKVDKNKTTGLPKIGNLPTRGIKKTYKELKREAVIRGMPFPHVVEADVHKLSSFIDHSNNRPNISLVDEFDAWVDKQLDQAGYSQDDPLRSSRLRLGFIGDQVEEGVVKTKRIKGVPKPKKVKRERDDNGLYKGTKKSYTFELAARGFSLERTKRRVMKKFPDASEKSIKIWYGSYVRNSKK